MTELLNIIFILIGSYSLIIWAYSKKENCSLEEAWKEVNKLLCNRNGPRSGNDNQIIIHDFVTRVWLILKAVDGEVFSKINELNETGTQVCNVEDKGDSIYEIKWLFPCLNEQKAEVEALIRGIASDYGFIVIDCSWEQVMGRLEAVCIRIDVSGGNSKLAQNLLLKKRNRLIASLEPPEEDYDDEL
jgi:hypothetical protein